MQARHLGPLNWSLTWTVKWTCFLIRWRWQGPGEGGAPISYIYCPCYFLVFILYLPNWVYWVGFGPAMAFKTHLWNVNFIELLTFWCLLEICINYQLYCPCCCPLMGWTAILPTCWTDCCLWSLPTSAAANECRCQRVPQPCCRCRAWLPSVRRLHIYI